MAHRLLSSRDSGGRRPQDDACAGWVVAVQVWLDLLQQPQKEAVAAAIVTPPGRRKRRQAAIVERKYRNRGATVAIGHNRCRCHHPGHRHRLNENRWFFPHRSLTAIRSLPTTQDHLPQKRDYNDQTPFITDSPPALSKPFAIIHQQCLQERTFRAVAASVAAWLGEVQYLINLCENRYLFTLGLFAGAMRGQVNLLPPARSPQVIEDLRVRYPSSQVITDAWISERVDDLSMPSDPSLQDKIPAPEPGSLQLIAFTSGSTGQPRAWKKSWAVLKRCASLALEALQLQGRSWAVVATTPSQHMYGLETSIVWPLCSDLLLTDRRPFYPEDIRRQVQDSPLPVVLVSTPLHLKACLDSAGQWHNLAFILSSTAPLEPALAMALEVATGVPVLELYGSTETLSFAWRRSAREELWHPYRGVKLACRENETLVTAPWLTQPIVLADRFESAGEGGFKALGRHSDLVKIAGKRHSLAELNRLLTSIDGIDDGCCFITRHGRVAALVVSRLDKSDIRRHLKPHLDEVFLPRPIHHVSHIPRNDSGKIIQAELQRLLEAVVRED